MEQLILNLPKELVAQLRQECAKQSISPNDFIEGLIIEKLPKQKQKDKKEG